MPGLGKRFKKLELSGKTFGRLTVLQVSSRAKNKHGSIIWDCRCTCGREIMIVGKNMVSGNTRSCGCLQRERTIQANKSRKRK